LATSHANWLAKFESPSRITVRVDHAAYPRDHACSQSDVLATMYHSLGLRADLEIHDREGRPYRLCDGTPLPIFG
jgi:hypothetical protein